MIRDNFGLQIQDGRQRNIEKPMKVISLKPNVPKKEMKQLFLLRLASQF